VTANDKRLRALWLDGRNIFHREGRQAVRPAKRYPSSHSARPCRLEALRELRGQQIQVAIGERRSAPAQLFVERLPSAVRSTSSASRRVSRRRGSSWCAKLNNRWCRPPPRVVPLNLGSTCLTSSAQSRSRRLLVRSGGMTFGRGGCILTYQRAAVAFGGSAFRCEPDSSRPRGDVGHRFRRDPFCFLRRSGKSLDW